MTMFGIGLSVFGTTRTRALLTFSIWLTMLAVAMRRHVFSKFLGHRFYFIRFFVLAIMTKFFDKMFLHALCHGHEFLARIFPLLIGCFVRCFGLAFMVC